VPELPEAERARALVESKALGREIVAVDDSDTYVTRPHSPGQIADALVGRSLTAAHRRGKSMWFETSDDGPLLFLHLGMAGRIAIDEEPAPNPRWDRFTLEFADGGKLALRDRRRLGRAIIDPDLSRLGPDAAEISAKDFRERVGRSATPIKARLMDQSAIAGVGNLLADEILWQARQDPRRPASDFSEEELDALRRATRKVIRDSVRLGGAHTGTLNPHRVRGGHCPRCGTELMRDRIGGRTTYWCPKEQVAG
jgi:formamidopyrimidine-DNA glycosylase